MYSLLPKESIDNPNSLNDFFTEMHEAYKKGKAPMSEEQTKCTISVMMANNDIIDKMYLDFDKEWPFNGFFKRCTIFPIKYEKRLLVWLGLMTFEFNIGGMILSAYYVQWWANQEQNKYITVKNEIDINGLSLKSVLERCFPYGLFNKALIHEWWDKQKVHALPDNLIDHPAAALSFMPTKKMEPIVP
jgi:hypothetical protein